MALRFLAEEGLLVSEAKRGPRSARRIADLDRFLEDDAAAVAAEDPSRVRVSDMTTFGSVDVYLDVDSLAGLESAALNVGLDPIEGGRLRLRPFPTVRSSRPERASSSEEDLLVHYKWCDAE